MAAFPIARASGASPYAILNQTPYLDAGTRMVNGKMICKYMYDHSVGSLQDAVAAVRLLLRAHPNLVPTFPQDPRSLEIEVDSNPYLIINGRAVCLAPERRAPAEARSDFKDWEFSENLIEAPIQCSRGHYLELHRFGFWMERVGTRCPHGEDHDISLPLLVNELLRDEIREFVLSIREAGDRLALIESRLTLNRLNSQREIAALQQQIQRTPQVDAVAILGGTAKILLKSGGKKMLVTVGKIIAKNKGKVVAKSIAKGIPGVSLVVGIGLGAHRLLTAEEFNKMTGLLAGGEVLSGLVAVIPVYGTAASIAIDATLLAADMRESLQARWARNDGIEIDVQQGDPNEILSINFSEYFHSEQEYESDNGEICKLDPNPMAEDWPRESFDSVRQIFNLAICGQHR